VAAGRGAARAALPEGGRGRRASTEPLERMLRIHCLQLWFNLSDPAVEEPLYDSVAMHAFAGIDLGQEVAPDETTVCKFRHLLERHKLGKELLKTVNAHLAGQGNKMSNGTIVDATIICALSSTKDKEEKRDPEMHQTAKGKQWYFGMKAHIAVDSRHKLMAAMRHCGRKRPGSALVSDHRSFFALHPLTTFRPSTHRLESYHASERC
jgi:transposase, IS5 family